MAELTKTQHVKQSARTMSLGLSDRFKTLGASAKVSAATGQQSDASRAAGCGSF